MKNAGILILFLLFSGFLFSQGIPTLTQKDLLDKNDLRKKSGWLMLELDSNFQEVENNEVVSHRLYEFVNSKGQYASSFTKRIGFPSKDPHSYEVNEAVDSLHLIDGVLKFYNKNDQLILKYIYKDGFLLKVFEYAWTGNYNGGIKTLIEFVPSKESVELYANYFDADGKITSDSHELNDGEKYITLSGNKTIDRN